MALTCYCQDCGSPTLYTLQPPKLCCQCGARFGGETTMAKIKPKQIVVAPPRPAPRASRTSRSNQSYEADESENLDEVTEVPNISSLDFEIEGGADKGVKFENILKSGQAPLGIKREKGKKVSKKQILEQIRQEGSGSRRDSVEIDE